MKPKNLCRDFHFSNRKPKNLCRDFHFSNRKPEKDCKLFHFSNRKPEKDCKLFHFSNRKPEKDAVFFIFPTGNLKKTANFFIFPTGNLKKTIVFSTFPTGNMLLTVWVYDKIPSSLPNTSETRSAGVTTMGFLSYALLIRGLPFDVAGRYAKAKSADQLATRLLAGTKVFKVEVEVGALPFGVASSPSIAPQKKI
jgi:hypothetical protein